MAKIKVFQEFFKFGKNHTSKPLINQGFSAIDLRNKQKLKSVETSVSLGIGGDKLYKDLLEDIVKVSSHPWRDYTDCVRDSLNRKIRKEIEAALSQPPSPRDLEIEQIIEEERIKWESDKAEFETNPLHWNNNKRRRHGLSTLRGSLNKDRVTKFHSFKPTPRVFFAIEDVIDELLPKRIDDNFNQFVDVKDLSI